MANQDDFSSDSFFIAVVTSEALKGLPREKYEEFTWFLFNASEETQRKFFDIFKQEQSIILDFEKQKAEVAHKLFAEYESNANQENNKFKKLIIRRKESDSAVHEKAHEAELLNNL